MMKNVYQIPANAKEQYKELCEDEPSIPLMMQAWWLDAVCPDQWDVCMVQEDEKIVGALPYHYRHKWPFVCVLQPQLTQYTGVWICPREYKSENERLGYEKSVMNSLIAQIESKHLDYFFQNFHYKITNWLPFYWKGYKQTTRYTYVIDNIANQEKVFGAFTYAKQKQIHKSEKILHLDLGMSPAQFYAHHKQSLAAEGKKISYSYGLFQHLWTDATGRKQGQILALKDNDGNVHTCLFLVWDHASAYNLICSRMKRFASSGASTLIIWEAIKFLKNKSKSFDFEGSMFEGVENSFRQFGTRQCPYFEIKKYSSGLFHFCFLLKMQMRKNR